MSEYSGCTDFEPLTESYKEEDKRGAKTSKLAEFLKTPEMKKLRKKAMKFQGADKLIKKIKESGEA